jgi:8-oxo-dGTP pyrophosphatase MutT (NUDIX family)
MSKKRTILLPEIRRSNSIRGCGIILVTSSNDVLMVYQNSSQKLSVPKGHLKYGETIEDCAMRELKEETGIDLFSYNVSYQTTTTASRYKFLVFRLNEDRKNIQIEVQDKQEIAFATWYPSSLLTKLCMNNVSIIALRKARILA